MDLRILGILARAIIDVIAPRTIAARVVDALFSRLADRRVHQDKEALADLLDACWEFYIEARKEAAPPDDKGP